MTEDHRPIGDYLRERRERILSNREEAERREQERIAKPFLADLDVMVHNVSEIVRHCKLRDNDELVINGRMRVGSLYITREYKSDINEVKEMERQRKTSSDSSLVKAFIQRVFENFKNAGGGKAFKDYCDRERLNVELTLSDQGVIDCYVVWQ